MPRPKKVEEIKESIENENESHILKVMDRLTRKVIKIDSSKEKDWKTKYLHCSGVEFN